MVAAGGDAGRAALAEIADEDGEDAAGAGGLALGRGEDGVHLLVGHGNLVDDVENCALAFGEKPSTASVTSRRMAGSGVPVFISASMRWRVCFSISGSARISLVRSAGSAM